MGSAASVNVDPTCELLGDRVEIAKQLQVESFGRDNTVNSQTAEKTLSSGSISDEKSRERSNTTKSRSTGSLWSLRFKGKGTNSDIVNSSYSAEASEVKILSLNKKIRDLQQENERLKRELDSLRKSNSKWRNNCQKAERDSAQSKERAKAFEDELEKVKKQSKSYREEKEKENYVLLKRIHELENTLRSSGDPTGRGSLHPLPERLIASFEYDADVENLSLFKAPGVLVDEKMPDFNTVFPLLAQVISNLKPPNKNKTFRIFLFADKDAKRDATFFIKVMYPQLQQLCTESGRFLVMVESYGNNTKSEEKDEKWEAQMLAKCDLFFGMLGNTDNRYLLNKWKSFYNIFNTRGRPMFFCFKDAKYNAAGGTELAHFLDSVAEETRVSFYTQATTLIKEYNEAIQDAVKEHFGLSFESKDKKHCGLDISDEELISDCESSLKQLDILHMLTRSRTIVRYGKYFETLDEYVCDVGPRPPLLVSGASGSGKTTLLAKWITRQLTSGENVVLYNFVGGTTNDVFTNPAHVMRRITSQLLGLFPCLYSMMHCDPVKCEEYLPRILKTVSGKVNTNVVIVIDSVDKLQNASSTHHLSWLNDLLPSTVRVILSVTSGNEPSHWRTWKTVNISPLTFKESCDVLVSCWQHPLIHLQNDEASHLLNQLMESAIVSPLFLTMLSCELSNESNTTSAIQKYVSFNNVVEMSVSILKSVQDNKGTLVSQILALICASRSGLAEAELMDILALQWSNWEPLVKCLLYDRPILREVNDLLVVSNDQILKAIFIHLNGNGIVRQSRERLVTFYTDKLKSSGVSPALIDQLPWLLVQLDDKENLKIVISRIDVFLLFMKRSLFSDLLGYWKYLGVEGASFGRTYMDAIRKQEGETPCLEVALRYEILGRFLKGIDVRSLAMKCLERSLETKEVMLEADDIWVGQSLHHLADLYVLLGNFESAEASYKQTLEINENTLGKDHPLVAKELECLAYVKKKQNKEKVCTELQRKAARIRRKSALPKMSSLSSSNSLDCRLIQVNNLDVGRKTPETASSLHNVGVLLLLEKRYQDAETLFMKSFAMRESLFGGNDLVATQSLDRLASLYDDRKMYSEAITYHKKSLAIKRQKLEKGDPNLIATMNRLAIAYRRNGDLQGSEAAYSDVLTALKDRDTKDPMIATALHNLAVINSDQKKLNEALKLFEQALKIYEESLGESHPKVAESLRNIAKVHLDLGNAEEASSYLLRSQKIQDDNLTMTTVSSLNSSANFSNDGTLELKDG